MSLDVPPSGVKQRYGVLAAGCGCAAESGAAIRSDMVIPKLTLLSDDEVHLFSGVHSSVQWCPFHLQAASAVARRPASL
jgi:hypothetical protein